MNDFVKPAKVTWTLEDENKLAELSARYRQWQNEELPKIHNEFAKLINHEVPLDCIHHAMANATAIIALLAPFKR